MSDLATAIRRYKEHNDRLEHSLGVDLRAARLQQAEEALLTAARRFAASKGKVRDKCQRDLLDAVVALHQAEYGP